MTQPAGTVCTEIAGMAEMVGMAGTRRGFERGGLECRDDFARSGFFDGVRGPNGSDFSDRTVFGGRSALLRLTDLLFRLGLAGPPFRPALSSLSFAPRGSPLRLSGVSLGLADSPLALAGPTFRSGGLAFGLGPRALPLGPASAALTFGLTSADLDPDSEVGWRTRDLWTSRAWLTARRVRCGEA